MGFEPGGLVGTGCGTGVGLAGYGVGFETGFFDGIGCGMGVGFDGR